MQKNIILAVFLVSTLLIACAGLTPPFEPQAFGPEKTYAIASIYCEPTIEGQDIETMESTIKVIKGKGAHRFNAKSVLENSTPVIVREFARSPRYRLIPPKQTLNSAAYRKTPADEQALLAEKKLIAKGYKYFWNGAKLGQLAEKLGVDGVIVISAKFGYHFFGRKTGAFGIGLAAEGKTSPEINMTAAFYDRQGKYVWKHSVHRILREGAPSEGETADIVKLEPLMVKASGLVAQSLLNSLDRRMQ